MKEDFEGMENSINISVSPLQVLLTLAFQIWIIVFPILILRKLNYLTDLIHSHLEPENESS